MINIDRYIFRDSDGKAWLNNNIIEMKRYGEYIFVERLARYEEAGLTPEKASAIKGLLLSLCEGLAETVTEVESKRNAGCSCGSCCSCCGSCAGNDFDLPCHALRRTLKAYRGTIADSLKEVFDFTDENINMLTKGTEND